MSIKTYTECTCDRCGEAVDARPPNNLAAPPRWMLVRTTTSKKEKDGGVVGVDEERLTCPSCAALVAKVLTPLRRKKRS